MRELLTGRRDGAVMEQPLRLDRKGEAPQSVDRGGGGPTGHVVGGGLYRPLQRLRCPVDLPAHREQS